MTHEEIIAMAREAGFHEAEADVHADRLSGFFEMAVAGERERLFGKAQHDGEMRLILHRGEDGECFAAAAHFSAEQTHCGPDDLLQMAVGRLDDRLDAGIAAAIRARDQKEGA